ncbi:MAG: hypothetical protein RLZZ24_125 [Pseudomonadota bacterium]
MKDHPLRPALHNEVHARPPEPIHAPMAIAHVVMVVDKESAAASRAHLVQLLRDHHLPSPDEHTNHVRMDLGAFRLRWELHTEFVSWTFMRQGQEGMLHSPTQPLTAIQVVPQQWLATLPGQCLTRLHMWMLSAQAADGQLSFDELLFEETLVASTVADGHGEVYTDFQMHADGYGRMVLVTGSLTPRRQGRLVQQLLEIETYRMAAMLGLPAARQASHVLADAERELASLAQAIRSANATDEADLLDRLTRLAGEVEGQYAATHARFSATRAYFELVDRRIHEIAETRMAGMQTIAEFMQRRLSPARSTCEWAARRQTALSERVSRMSNLLRTRVDFEQQQSSRDLLATMNERQGLQLKLQSTVEGLSVAAISYYIVGLLHYGALGLQSRGWIEHPHAWTAAAVPLVALTVWGFMRRLHNTVFKP